MKTPEEMAEEYCEDHDECEHARIAFLAGYEAGREMSEKEIFDCYIELRKKHGQQEPETRPVVEKFSLTLIEKKGFF